MRGPRDDTEYLCTLCGRTGFRQFDENKPPLSAGHRCRNRDKCRDRIRAAIEEHNRLLALVEAAQAVPPRDKTPDKTAAQIAQKPALRMPVVKSDGGDLQARALAYRVPVDNITARCMDCTRIWTAPNPRANVTKHEENMNHLVEVVAR